MDIIALFASILSPIIAVIIAIWASRSSAKDTAKQIAALEESTTKQVESIKSLSKQMVEASIKQVELEIEKNVLLANQAKQEWEGIQSINNGGLAHIQEWKSQVMKDFQEKKPERDYRLYCKFVNDLKALKIGLESNKNIIN